MMTVTMSGRVRILSQLLQLSIAAVFLGIAVHALTDSATRDRGTSIAGVAADPVYLTAAGEQWFHRTLPLSGSICNICDCIASQSLRRDGIYEEALLRTGSRDGARRRAARRLSVDCARQPMLASADKASTLILEKTA